MSRPPVVDEMLVIYDWIEEELRAGRTSIFMLHTILDVGDRLMRVKDQLSDEDKAEIIKRTRQVDALVDHLEETL